MKNRSMHMTGGLGLLLIALLMATSGCSLDTGLAGQSGSIVIQVGGALSRSTTVTPNLTGTISKFVITGTGPENETFTDTLTKGVNNTLSRSNLAAGNWTFTVAGKTSDDKTVATGTSGTILIENNNTKEVAIELSPITTGPGVTGTFAISATTTDTTLTALTGYIIKPDNSQVAFTGKLVDGVWVIDPSNLTLDVGTSYTVVVNATNNDTPAKVASNIFALNVYQNCTSTLTLSYTASSFMTGSGTGSITITVKELAWNPTITFVTDPVNTTSITTGGTIKVTATVTASPDSYKWYLDGVEQVQGTPSLTITTGSTLGPGGHVLTLIAKKTVNSVVYQASEQYTFSVSNPQ